MSNVKYQILLITDSPAGTSSSYLKFCTQKRFVHLFILLSDFLEYLEQCFFCNEPVNRPTNDEVQWMFFLSS